MTPKRAAILCFIRDYHKGYGCAPTYAEIGANFNISRTTVFEAVSWLVKAGHLERTPYEARSLAIPDDAKAVAASRLAALATVLARAGLAELAADAEEIRGVLTGKAGAA